jgi:hypothetical protein
MGADEWMSDYLAALVRVHKGLVDEVYVDVRHLTLGMAIRR